MQPYTDFQALPSGEESGVGWSDYSENDLIRWINQHLARTAPPLTISDLTDFNVCNGVAIGLLLESVGNLKLNGLLLQPGTRVERLHNVHEVFAALRRLDVRLDNMQPEDVMNGNKNAILNLILAVSSHFSNRPRGRRSVSPDYKYGGRPYSGFSSPRSSSRQTPVDRYGHWGSSVSSSPTANMQPMEHYTELTNPRYSHEVVGPTVYSNSNSSPRSRSTMTVMFSGQRSPTSVRRSDSRSSDASGTASPMDTHITKSRTFPGHYVGQRQSVTNHDPVTRSSVPVSHTAPELPHYIESMNELSTLKTQLNNISRLIASEATVDFPTTDYPPKSAQTEYHLDLSNKLKHAEQQISELTRILHTKDQTLRQKEKEIAWLQEALRNLQAVLFQREGGAQHSGGNTRRHAGQTYSQPSFAPQPSKRRSTDHHALLSSESHAHSHDPREKQAIPDFGQAEQSKRRSRSRDRTRQSSPGRARTSSGLPKSDGHVKRMSMDLEAKHAVAHAEQSYNPAIRY